MSSNTIFLDESYEIDGVVMTGKEIKEAIIDSMIIRGDDSE